jgi:Tfp pilus assembly protein PilN
VENYIKTYHENQLRVIGFSLGNVVASQLVGFVKNTFIETSNKVIVFDKQKVRTISSLTTTTIDKQDINGIQVSSKRVLSLAGILAYYATQKQTVSNFSKRLDTLETDFKGHRFFDIGLKVGLGTVFVLLLVSFLLFSNYTANINELTASLELNKTHKNALLKLSEVVQKKEQLITRFSLASSKTSWYITQLGSTVPTSVLLSEIQYQPLVKTIKEEKEILLHLRILTVKGMAGNGTDFSNWIHALEREDWIEKVIIKSYGLGKKTATEFELSIEIK